MRTVGEVTAGLAEALRSASATLLGRFYSGTVLGFEATADSTNPAGCQAGLAICKRKRVAICTGDGPKAEGRGLIARSAGIHLSSVGSWHAQCFIP